jgi:CRISPR-associated protein Cmr2
VEDVHHGQLIYSGGDDVLAMLPADEAIACATDLRAAFQGRLADMTRDCRNLFNDKAPEGFLWPKDLAWPLLVPGPRMTVSVGVAIGHIKEPLQDMIQEAQRAEKRAKADPQKLVYKRKSDDPSRHGQEWVSTGGWGRNALAVTLFKRSGEMIQWGARFGSVAYDLLKMLRKHFRQPWGKPDAEVPITGRFPYRLAELLSKYGPNKPISDIKDIVLREVQFVVSRQTLTDEKSAQLQGGGGAGQPFKREELTTKGDNYLDELAEFSWKRPDSETLTRVPRPLQDFINLFLLEAFIRRQAD